jgi:hypothetical protein
MDALLEQPPLGNPVGIAKHYNGFLKLCRQRIDQLGVTFETMDRICGFPEGYYSAIMNGKKAASVYSFFVIARALALMPTFVHDAAELERLQQRDDWIKYRRKGARWRDRGGTIRLGSDFFRLIGQKGSRQYALKHSCAARSASARKAALARWARRRASQTATD